MTPANGRPARPRHVRLKLDRIARRVAPRTSRSARLDGARSKAAAHRVAERSSLPSARAISASAANNRDANARVTPRLIAAAGATLENMSQGILMIDRNGRVPVINQRAFDLLGFPLVTSPDVTRADVGMSPSCGTRIILHLPCWSRVFLFGQLPEHRRAHAAHVKNVQAATGTSATPCGSAVRHGRYMALETMAGISDEPVVGLPQW